MKLYKERRKIIVVQCPFHSRLPWVASNDALNSSSDRVLQMNSANGSWGLELPKRESEEKFQGDWTGLRLSEWFWGRVGVGVGVDTEAEGVIDVSASVVIWASPVSKAKSMGGIDILCPGHVIGTGWVSPEEAGATSGTNLQMVNNYWLTPGLAYAGAQVHNSYQFCIPEFASCAPFTS